MPSPLQASQTHGVELPLGGIMWGFCRHPVGRRKRLGLRGDLRMVFHWHCCNAALSAKREASRASLILARDAAARRESASCRASRETESRARARPDARAVQNARVTREETGRAKFSASSVRPRSERTVDSITKRNEWSRGRAVARTRPAEGCGRVTAKRRHSSSPWRSPVSNQLSAREEAPMRPDPAWHSMINPSRISHLRQPREVQVAANARFYSDENTSDQPGGISRIRS